MMAATVSRAELITALGVQPKQLGAWVRSGMPVKGKGAAARFDITKVGKWLVANVRATESPAADVAPQPPPRSAAGEGATWLAALRGARPAIRKLLGDRKLSSLKDVAAAFDVSPNTVKVNWRKLGGLPGEEGAWPLAEILLWKLDRDVVPAETQTAPQAPQRLNSLDRKREADARKSEADASKKELQNQREQGNLVYRDDIEREWTEALLVTRHILSRVHANLLPRFPRELAHELADEVRKEIEHALEVLAGSDVLARDEHH